MTILNSSSQDAHETTAPPTTNDGELRKVLASLDLSPRKRRWPLAVLGLAIGVGGTIGVQTYLDRQDDNDVALAAEEVELATAPVETRDLLEEVEWNATLGFGEVIDVSTTTSGTVTYAADPGATLSRGDVLATVGNEPMVLLYGEIPPWRALQEGDSGSDVRQLEANLVALGFDPDITVTVDNDFTYNTTLMVQRWQEALGAEITGEVVQDAQLIAPGPVTVATAPAVGSQTGTGSFASIDVQSVAMTIVNDGAGVIDSFAERGTVVETGTVLFELDESPVVALISPDAIGTLLATPGSDTEALEQALNDGGFDPDTEMTIDGIVTDATESAVGRWQTSVGLPVTEIADSSGYVLISPARGALGLAVDGPLVLPGTDLVAGRVTMNLVAQTMSTVVPIVVADADEFEVGMEVEVELADETLYTAVVSDIGTTVTPGAGDEDPTIDVTVLLTGETSDVIAGPAIVRTISSRIDGATVVPTRSLVSLVEGGFAVERSNDDDTSTLIQVELGVFSDGMVEVLDSQLSPGDLLVVPS